MLRMALVFVEPVLALRAFVLDAVVRVASQGLLVRLLVEPVHQEEVPVLRLQSLSELALLRLEAKHDEELQGHPFRATLQAQQAPETPSGPLLWIPGPLEKLKMQAAAKKMRASIKCSLPIWRFLFRRQGEIAALES